jgi:hypothetical protein
MFDSSVAIKSRISNLVSEKIHQMKVELAAEMFGDIWEDEPLYEYIEGLDEANVMKMGRTKVVRVRIRKGKVQRRVKLSAVAGYTIRGGKMTRMTSQERRHRKMAARKAVRKRKAHMSQSIRKRKISLRRRKAFGL